MTRIVGREHCDGQCDLCLSQSQLLGSLARASNGTSGYERETEFDLDGR